MSHEILLFDRYNIKQCSHSNKSSQRSWIMFACFKRSSCKCNIEKLPEWVGGACDCPCDLGKRSLNDTLNIGLSKGRKLTYPVDYLCYAKNIPSMVNSGLVWEYNYTKHGQLACIFCDVKFEWTKFMDIDGLHRRISPHCAWLDRRDRGKNMELNVLWDLPKHMMVENEFVCCIKCDVLLPFDECYVASSGGSIKKINNLENLHLEKSPHCA